MTPEDERRLQELEGLAKRYRSRIAEMKPLLLELAVLSDEAINEGDPALFGGFRDSARAILRTSKDGALV